MVREPAATPRIIDCHAHLTKTPLYGRGSKTQLLADMETAGVSTVLIMGECLSSPLWFGTKELLQEVGDDGSDDPRLKVIAGIDADGDIEAQIGGYEPEIKRGKIVAFKLYPGYQYFYPSDSKLKPLYAAAARLQVPVVIHTGDLFTEGASQPPLLKYSHPLGVDEAAALNPETTFILAHLGNPWTIDAAEVVYKNPNCYADLSGLFLSGASQECIDLVSEKLEEAIAYLGSAEKLLFGTDSPLIGHAEYVEFFKRVIPEQDHEAFFAGNAERLFRL